MSTLKNLWEKERKIQVIENLKQNIENDILRAANEVSEKKKTNEYLSDIADDFEEYRDDLINVKKQQEHRIRKLVEYLEINLKDAGLTSVQLRKLNKEREDILERLRVIRNDLKNIKQSNY
tara:strand:+ start:331 stop:693 length:363 start_codon:yes stop_codon:yes gene_type:complete